jgi:hypothetical protein
MEIEIKQEFFPNCGGVTKVYLAPTGEVIPPNQWIQYGLASDIGCCCNGK